MADNRLKYECREGVNLFTMHAAGYCNKYLFYYFENSFVQKDKSVL